MGKVSYKRTSGGPFAKTADLYGSFELAHLTKVVFISATKQALRLALVSSFSLEFHSELTGTVCSSRPNLTAKNLCKARYEF